MPPSGTQSDFKSNNFENNMGKESQFRIPSKYVAKKQCKMKKADDRAI